MTIGHELYGSGPEGVVLIHDFYGCRQTYDDVRRYLAPEEFSYAFMEMRGYGASRAMTGAYTPEEVAADVFDLADHHGWDRFHLVGHSISGMFAQRALVDGGGRVKSAVLMTPVHCTGLSFSEEGWALLAGSLDDDEKLAGAFDALTGNRLSPEWLAYKVKQMRGAGSAEPKRAYLKNAREGGFLDEARGNTTPIRILIGPYDMEPFSPETTEKTLLQWYPNSEMLVIENSGHYPQQESPVTTAGAIVSFQRRHSG